MGTTVKSQKKVVFKTLGWSYKDEKEGFVIYISGISKETPGGETDETCVQLRVNGYTPSCFVELPGGIKWTDHAKKKLIGHILMAATRENDGYSSDSELEEGKKIYGFMRPVRYWFEEKFDFYGKIPKSYLFLAFAYRGDMQRFAWWMLKSQRITGFLPNIACNNFKPKTFLVHEHSIDPLIAFTHERNLKLASWVQVVGGKLLEDHGILGVEYWSCKYDQIFPFETTECLFPKYMSFDFETYSKNHNSKIPDACVPENVIFHIAATMGRIGNPDKKIVLLSLARVLPCQEIQPLSKEGYMRTKDYRHQVIVKNFKTEKAMLLAFRDLIMEENPDIFVGYNILKFDWDYLITRSEMAGILTRMLRMSRIPDMPATVDKINWSSSAYGVQEGRYVNAHGRVNVDVILEIQRNYKLPKYSLDVVSEYFLKERKEDVSPGQLFMCWSFYRTVFDGQAQSKDPDTIMSSIHVIFPPLKVSGFVKEYKSKIVDVFRQDFADQDPCLVDDAKWEKLKRLAQEMITITGYYCVIDTILPLDLMDKLVLWVNMEAMSNIMRVPTSFLHTRGQQIRVLSQVYPAAKQANCVIRHAKYQEISDRKFVGATVMEAKENFYKGVGLYDFESLYPTEMITNNICHSTFIDDLLERSKQVPDSECKIFIVESHRYCEHDERKKKANGKKEKENMLCGTTRYRFRKVRYVETPTGFEIQGEGIMPQLERKLLAERKLVKKEMFKQQSRLKMHLGEASQDDIAFFKKMGFEIIPEGFLDSQQEASLKMLVKILDANQLAIKVSCNSMYGTMGARTGPIPLLAGAELITFMGRQHLKESKNRIIQQHDGFVIYGDSVPGDTPILVRDREGVMPHYKTIANLFGNPEKVNKIRGKKITYSGLECWTEEGFTKILYVIRHKTQKRMYRITTNTGIIEVTEDHSLLNHQGEIIQPHSLRVGDKLLHHDLPKIGGTTSVKIAYVLGLFFGNGLCMAQDVDIFQIYNTNSYVLERAKSSLEMFFGTAFVIVRENGRLFSRQRFVLTPNPKCFKHDTFQLALYTWINMFYNPWPEIKVPDIIFSADMKSRREFFKGYLDSTGGEQIGCVDKLGAAGIYLVGASLGYQMGTKKYTRGGVTRMTLRKNTQDSGTISRIQDLGIVIDYVYDLETYNHHFSAGVGGIVVHNTDSCMATYPRLDSSINPFDNAAKVVKDVTHFLKCQLLGFELDTKLEGLNKFMYDSLPVNLQHECEFKYILLLTPKRYIAYVMNKEGKVIGKVKKGVVGVRRDGCAFLSKVYGLVTEAIFDGKSLEETKNIILEQTIELFTRRTPEKDLVIYKAINRFEKYAKKDAKGRILSLKKDSQGSILGPSEKESTSKNPLDWYYHQPQSHVVLALKMLKRGDSIPPNTRMEYIFLRTAKDPKEEKQKDKIEDFSFYMENKVLGMRLDFEYYMEHQLLKPLSELMTVKFGYPQERESLEKRLTKSLDDLPKSLKKLVAPKKSIKDKVLYLLNIDLYPFAVQGGKINQDGQVAKSVFLPDEIKKCLDLCTSWYTEQWLDFYRFGHGIGKVRRRKKKGFHPFLLDLLQTLQRRNSVVKKLDQLFTRQYLNHLAKPEPV